MAEQIHRMSSRMLGLDLETGITPPSSPHHLSSEGKMKEEIHSKVEIFPPLKSQVEGDVETLEEAYLQPSNPPLNDMNSPVIVEVPTQTCSLLHQRYTPQT